MEARARLGRTAWSARVPLDPLPAGNQRPSLHRKAGQGAGRGPGGPPHHEERGITLLEMLVVAAIIGLIVGITFPAATTGLDSMRLASATRSVSSFLNGALNRADRRQQPIELVISPKENLFTLYSTEPGFTRELKLPEGVLLEAVLPEEREDPDLVRRFVLMPNASAPAIGIQIANRHGARRIVRLDPMTGFPRVESVH